MEDNEMTKGDRFDVDNVKFDDEGNPVLPNINFRVPKQYRKEFLKMMIDEVRTTPGEQLMAIFVLFMRRFRAEAVARETATGQLEGSRRRIPDYASKIVAEKPVQGERLNSGQ